MRLSLRALAPLSLAFFAAAAQAASPPKLTLGGQLRARAESASIQSYASPGLRRAQDLFLLRTRVNVDADMPEQRLKAFVQLQDSRTAGQEPAVNANERNLDLHQGYIDVLSLWDAPLDLRVGRWEMSYGDQRLVSPLDWNNVARAWNGGRLRGRWDSGWADAFVTNIKEVAASRADGHFWGLYASCAAVERHELDAYVFGRDNGDGSYVNEHGTRGNLSDRTAGLRAKGAWGRADWTAEGARQFGRKAGQSVRAHGTAVTLRYTFARDWAPFVGVEHTYGSGDASPGDNVAQTFDQLYTFGHFYYGYQDLNGWRNGHDFVLRVGASPAKGWKALLEGHRFLLDHSFDAWYDFTGAAAARDATGAAGRDIGTEVDLTFRGPLRERINLWFGVSRFFAGPFVRRTTGRGDRDWAFLQAALDF